MNNPHALQPTSLYSLLASLWQHRELISQMVRRDVIGRYRGSVMGLTWSFFNPILLLTIYTFVFGVVFKARWGTSGDESTALFAVVLFIGMIVHSLFAECVNRAPTLMLVNVNYVKKVIFPLEVLPVVALGSGFFNLLVSMAVLLPVIYLVNGGVPWTCVFFPLLILPFLVITLGVAWFFAALGVYVRDVGQAVGILISVMMFASPVFYPLTAIPEKFRIWLYLNPITFVIEQGRAVMIFGKLPDWLGLAGYILASLIVVWMGYAFFQKTRKGFADVL